MRDVDRDMDIGVGCELVRIAGAGDGLEIIKRGACRNMEDAGAVGGTAAGEATMTLVEGGWMQFAHQHRFPHAAHPHSVAARPYVNLRTKTRRNY
jgi:hypothetical protein